MAEIEVLKENIEYEQMLGEGSCDTVVRGEYLIPDTHPDIEEVLILDVKPVITEKELLQDRIYVEGSLEYNILYLAKEDEGMGVHSLNYSDKFSNYIDIEGTDGRLTGAVNCEIEHIDCNIINERKIEIEGILNVSGEVYKNYNVDIIRDIDASNNIQMLKKPTTVDKMVGIIEEELEGKATVKISMDKPQVGKSLKTNVYLHKCEVVLNEGKANISAFAKVQMLYRGMDSKDIVLAEEDIYMSKEVVREDIGINMKSMTNCDIKDVDISIKQDDLGENRILEIEVKADVDVKLMNKEQYDVIEDAYSPTNVIEINKETYDLNVLHGMNEMDIIVKDNIQIPSDNPMATQCIMSKGDVVVTDKKLVEDKVVVEGIVKVNVIYRAKDEEKPVYTVGDELPFTATIDIAGTKIDMAGQVKANLESIDASIEADTIAVKAVVHIWAKVSYNQSKDFMTALNKSEENPPSKKASITIYVVQKGDTLWTIAKRYYTTIEDLVKVNDIKDPNVIKVGDKILIPGRARI